MTRALALLFLLCAGCATTNGGGSMQSRGTVAVWSEPDSALSARRGSPAGVTPARLDAVPADTSAYSPLWNGRDVPVWVQALGHLAAERARACQRWAMAPRPNPFGRMIHLPGCGELAERDSLEAVAGCDSLMHWKRNGYTISADPDSSYSAGDHAAVWGASLAPAEQAAPADSSWLYFTAPRHGSLGCEADTSRPLHGGQRVYLIRLRGQVPNYWRGMMQTVAGMDSVRLLTRPDTVWRASVQPGTRCSVRVAAGEYVAETVGQRCPSWRIARVGQ